MSVNRQSVWIKAETPGDLIRQLDQLDTTVPPRGCGRTKEHVQRAAICIFLSVFARAELFNFPLEIIESERPDFLLLTPSGTTGMEITEAVRQADAYLSSLDIDNHRMIGKNPALDDRLTRGQVMEYAEAETQPWERDEVETRWARDILSTINKKTEKFSGYEKGDKNWLYIYENLLLPNPKRELAAEKLHNNIRDDNAMPFDRVFIETNDNRIIQVSNELTFHAVNATRCNKII